jgi:hypothetical protein
MVITGIVLLAIYVPKVKYACAEPNLAFTPQEYNKQCKGNFVLNTGWEFTGKITNDNGAFILDLPYPKFRKMLDQVAQDGFFFPNYINQELYVYNKRHFSQYEQGRLGINSLYGCYSPYNITEIWISNSVTQHNIPSYTEYEFLCYHSHALSRKYVNYKFAKICMYLGIVLLVTGVVAPFVGVCTKQKNISYDGDDDCICCNNETVKTQNTLPVVTAPTIANEPVVTNEPYE